MLVKLVLQLIAMYVRPNCPAYCASEYILICSLGGGSAQEA